MNRLVKFSLVLSVVALTYLPAQTQAFEPGYDGNYRHHEHDRQGLRITQVATRSPAAHARLECGDIIVAVDGRTVHQPDDLHRLLHATGYQGELTVRDARTGCLREVRVYPQHGHIGVNVAQVRY